MINKLGAGVRRAPDAAWERRLGRWRSGEIELTDDEHERFMAERADMALIARYLGDDLDPAERARVEARARTDSEFWLDLHILNAMDGRIRAGLHDATLFRLHEMENARRGGRRLMAASIVFVGALLALAATNRVREAGRRLIERLADRAATAGLRSPQTFATTNADTTLTFALADIAVRGNSRLTADEQVRRSGGAGLMALDGEAAFHPWAASIIVRTATSVVHMTAGRYAVRSVPRTGVTFVTVDSGLAWLEPLGSEMLGGSQHQALRSVRAGDRAAVTRDGIVTVVASDSGFPVTAFAMPSGSSSLDTSVEQMKARTIYATFEPSIKAAHGIRK